MVAALLRDLAETEALDIPSFTDDEPQKQVELANDGTGTLNTVTFRSNGYGRLKATDAEILAALHRQYPFLEHYQQKATELSKRLNNPYLAIKFTPTITRGTKGYISSVGIRAYNPLCSTPHGTFRDTILKAELGYKKIYCYDVKSSIYRVSYLMTHGKWLDNNTDFYITMQEGAIQTLERENFKALAMRLYFGGSKERVYNNLVYNKDLSKFTDRQLADFRAAIYSLYDSMRVNLGSIYGSEIFLYESCIYMDLLEALLDRGLQVAQVYDAFYSDNADICAICQQLLPAIARAFYDKVRGVEPVTEPHTDLIDSLCTDSTLTACTLTSHVNCIAWQPTKTLATEIASNSYGY